jgi:decaprenylphospho-beta-D-ribofuranose 2-oxidase
MDLYRPERAAELSRVLEVETDHPVIARGGGRAYGDAALLDGGRGVIARRLDRILAFDASTGDVVVEPGISFADMIEIFLPRGWMVPVSPGTGFATIGGAVACDVHGKNHDRRGSFGDHVAWIDLVDAAGSERRISPHDDPVLFAATIGGMGLTGIIARIGFRLVPVAGAAIEVRHQPVRDLDAHLAALFASRETHAYSVGWIDALATGSALGRGIVELAQEPIDAVPPNRPRPQRVPIDAPGFIMNRHTIRLFNRFYAARIGPGGRTRCEHVGAFLYPLDALHDWNRIYGRRGFHQFQCVVPDSEAPRAMRQLLETIAAAGRASFLAVLKTLGSSGRGMMSFAMRGATLALDFPNAPGAIDFVRRLNRIARDHGGRVYLAKDSTLEADDFRAMYPEIPRFESVLERIDPTRRFCSGLSRRLAIRHAGVRS